MNDAPSPAHGRLSAELIAFVDGLDGRDPSLGDLVDQVGDRGFGLLLMILALPAALPLPAPGYATPFGVVIAVLAIQLMRGRQTPWIPDRFRKRRIPYRMLSFATKGGSLPLRAVELLVRPRLGGLARSKAFLSMVSVIILLMACSMILPVPLTNTAPAFTIFVLSAGILEEDGLVLAAGLLLAPVAGAISVLALYVASTSGLDAVEHTVKPIVKGWLGLS